MKVVRVEQTPNPDAVKFITDSRLVQSGVQSYESPEAGKGNPLAEALFGLGTITSVFYMDRFVSVTKGSEAGWDELIPKISEVIETKAVPADNSGTVSGRSDGSKNDIEIMEKINKVLDENVRPALAGDGGGLEVLGYHNFVLSVHYQGACGGCPSATRGTLFAIQNLLQKLVDSRIEVVPA